MFRYDYAEQNQYAEYMTRENKIFGSVRNPHSNIFIIDGDNKQNLPFQHGLKALSQVLKLVEADYGITPVFTEISPRGTFHIYYHSKLDKKKLVDYLNSETDDRINIEILSPNQNFRFPLSHDYYPIQYDKFLRCNQSNFYDLANALYRSFDHFFQSVNLAYQESTVQEMEIISIPVVVEKKKTPIQTTLKSSASIQEILDDSSLDITEGNRYRNEATLFALFRHAGITDHNQIISHVMNDKYKSSKDVDEYGLGWWRNHLEKAYEKLEKGFIPAKKSTPEFVSSLHLLSQEESNEMDHLIREYIGRKNLEEVPEIAIVLKECLCKIIYDAQNRKKVNPEYKKYYNELMEKGISELPDLPCVFFDRLRNHYKLPKKGFFYRNMVLEPCLYMQDKVPYSLNLFSRYAITLSNKTWLSLSDWGYTQRLESRFTFVKDATVKECLNKVRVELLGVVYRKAREIQNLVVSSYALLTQQSLIYISSGNGAARGCDEEEGYVGQYYDSVPDG
jgi:hypothetical protein